ncbi:MAG: polysaccharide biosynthesis protein [Nitrospinota bacterium]|nr:polysaccharide biosynthesis protein [Nitrospinota bacterium]MDH5678380.1 polysaccharide biosynthesis protein [Nitrospinota bacterium]MDH5755997.1 polysaccharide biosynthesis protein [Nitrospinota bacterium]
MDKWKDKRVLITGVCGTVGVELLRQVRAREVAEIIGLDNNESDLFFLEEENREDKRVRLYLGDVRDRDKLVRKTVGIDIILHAAALKHVILCEKSPRDAVQTNINGVQNIIDAALTNNVGYVLFTSSDKAVNPTNVMGTTKLMGERLMTAANAVKRQGGPVFASTRFGNILGSRGSVIPLFKKQIMDGGPVTLTDDRMTRFIMTVAQAAELVLQSVHMARGGEVFVTKMPVVRIKDLAMVMVQVLAPIYGHDPKDVDIWLMGAKAGEKLYEELLSEEETRRAVELDSFFSVMPAFKSVYEDISYDYPGKSGDEKLTRAYNSLTERPMKSEELKRFLMDNQLI